jgi:hypothetical protein
MTPSKCATVVDILLCIFVSEMIPHITKCRRLHSTEGKRLGNLLWPSSCTSVLWSSRNWRPELEAPPRWLQPTFLIWLEWSISFLSTKACSFHFWVIAPRGPTFHVISGWSSGDTHVILRWYSCDTHVIPYDTRGGILCSGHDCYVKNFSWLLVQQLLASCFLLMKQSAGCLRRLFTDFGCVRWILLHCRSWLRPLRVFFEGSGAGA